jgi:1,2-phenylacetyl-CoA epoxidase catalytic subunit
MRLTGRTRFRAQQRAFGPAKMVLQVEEEGIHTSSTGGHVESEVRRRWRDATVEDLTEMGLESLAGLSA